MAKPVLSQTQRRVLHALTSLIQGLATAPDAAIDRTDQFLKGISELSIIKGMLGEEDKDDVSGSEANLPVLETRNTFTDCGPQFYTYFSGVALLLRSLLEKVESDEIGLAFLNDIKKIHDNLAPEGKRDLMAIHKSNIPENKRKAPMDDSDDEVTFLSARARTSETTSTSNGNGIQVDPFEYLYPSSSTLATRPPSSYQAHHITLWQRIQVKAHYRPVVSTQQLPHPQDIRSTVYALHAIFGPSGVNHLRKLQWDLSYPNPPHHNNTVQWHSMLASQKPENIHWLWQCCVYFRDRAQKRATLGSDTYALNLARMEVRRLWDGDGYSASTLGLGSIIERELHRELGEGAKAMLLASVFGKGVLVILSQDAGLALEEVSLESLKHVVATVATLDGGVFQTRIRHVCTRAESMIDAALVGENERFHSATEETIESLERITE